MDFAELVRDRKVERVRDNEDTRFTVFLKNGDHARLRRVTKSIGFGMSDFVADLVSDALDQIENEFGKIGGEC